MGSILGYVYRVIVFRNYIFLCFSSFVLWDINLRRASKSEELLAVFPKWDCPSREQWASI